MVDIGERSLHYLPELLKKQSQIWKHIVRNLETVEFKQLRYFVVVAAALNITRAADQLNLPKSVVSKSIRQLEETLNCTLFERSTRAVRLTEAGEFLLPRAQSLLEETQCLFSDISTMSTAVSGQLKLAASPAFGRQLTRDVIPQYLKRYPEVNISLTLSYNYENLYDKGLDIAFRFGKVVDDRLVAKTLSNTTRYVVASPKYVATAPKLDEPTQLVDHNCLVFPVNTGVKEWVLANNKEQVSMEVTGQYQCSDVSAVKDATIAGIGVSLLPSTIIKHELATGELVRVLPDWSSPEKKLYAVYRKGLHKSPKVSAFLELLSDNF